MVHPVLSENYSRFLDLLDALLLVGLPAPLLPPPLLVSDEEVRVVAGGIWIGQLFCLLSAVCLLQLYL